MLSFPFRDTEPHYSIAVDSRVFENLAEGVALLERISTDL
jgi:hypothetical protein